MITGSVAAGVIGVIAAAVILVVAMAVVVATIIRVVSVIIFASRLRLASLALHTATEGEGPVNAAIRVAI
jgi:hypothetical protein